MKSASECRAQAQEWRALARNFYGNRRHHALDMAEHWEDLARQMDSANNRHLAGMLKAVYDNVASEPVPDIFEGLLKQLEAADSRAG